MLRPDNPPLVLVEGLEYRVCLAEASHQSQVRDFVIRIHIELSGYNDVAKEHQLADLESDFPELYLPDNWEDSVCWMLLDSTGHLVGCLGIKHHSFQITEISYFFLEAGVRGLGLGKALLKHVLRWIVENSIAINDHDSDYRYSKVRLLTLRGIYDTAIKLYEKEGFVVFDEMENSLFKVVYLELDLSMHINNHNK